MFDFFVLVFLTDTKKGFALMKTVLVILVTNVKIDSTEKYRVPVV